MDFTAVRRDLADALRTIEGLNVHDKWPGSVTSPAAIFGPPDTAAYRVTYSGGLIKATVTVMLLAAPTTAGTALDLLEPYLNDSGERSVAAAVDAFQAGSYSDATVTQVTESGIYSVGGADYLGAKFEISIAGSRG